MKMRAVLVSSFPVLSFLIASSLATAQKPAASPGPSKPSAVKKSAPSATKHRTTTAPLITEEQKEVYALGVSTFQSLAPFDLSPAELVIFKRALNDAATGKAAMDIGEWRSKVDALKTARASRAAEKRKIAAAAFVAKALTAPGATKTESGIIYRELTPGAGASPSATDVVKVNYRGTFPDGVEFDSSYKRNAPATFPLNQVIKCWTEAVQKMKVGGKSNLVCPPDMAYGESDRGPIPGGSTLVFDVELLEIVPPAK